MTLPARAIGFGRVQWLSTRTGGSVAACVTAAGVVVAALLPDSFDNTGLLRVMALGIAAAAAGLFLTTRGRVPEPPRPASP